MSKSHLMSTFCTMVFGVFTPAMQAAPVSGQGTWEGTLQARDFDGDAGTVEAYYDTVLDITWLRNANLAPTDQFGLTLSADEFDDTPNTVGTTGRMTWFNALAWIAGMNAANYGGVSHWRLPHTNPIDYFTSDDANYSYNGTEDRGYNVGAPATGYAGSTASEMAHMSYHTLGNLAYCDPVTSAVTYCSPLETGWGITNAGPFYNINTSSYWSATDYAPDTGNAWLFNFRFGDQDGVNKLVNRFAWAVHPGDIGMVLVDSDGDQVVDSVDNCILKANAGQQDGDSDGCGNACDADFDQNGITNFIDLGLFRAVFSTTDPTADLDSNGTVNFLDFSIFRDLFFTEPGPSAAGSCL